MLMQATRSKKRLFAGVAAAALSLSLFAGCGDTADTPEPAQGSGNTAPSTAATDNTGTASGAETGGSNYEELSGKVVIYTSIYEDVIEMLDAKLEEVFPNADIEFFYGGTGTIQSKVAAEMDAGQLGCDMLMVAEPSYALELMELGMLHAVPYADTDRLAFDYDPDGYWYPVRISNMAMAYNPELNDLADLPTSLRDFAYDESVAGAISMSNPLTSGTAMASATALRDTYGYEYFDMLGRQGVMVESGSVALTKLQTGECKVIMILEESVLKLREEDDSEIEVIYPSDGTIVIPSPVMTINDEWNANANTELCEAITEWFLSEEGQAMIVRGWMHSVLKDFGTYPYDARTTEEILSNVMSVNWENCYRERDVIRTAFEESVAIEG